MIEAIKRDGNPVKITNGSFKGPINVTFEDGSKNSYRNPNKTWAGTHTLKADLETAFPEATIKVYIVEAK